MSQRLAVERVGVRFGDTMALDGVDVSVDRGEVVAVLGPSGSGKSTLLRVIAGLQRMDSGVVRVDGLDLHLVPPHRRGIGLMFQDHALFPHRDVAGNIAFGLRMQGRRPSDVASRVERLMELVDLGGFGPRRIQTLSGGEQQRVALARALAPEPEVLLLDEPLGALDRGLRERLLVEMRALFTRMELPVVAVTHDQAEAFSFADRVAVMDAGVILQIGTPSEVWGRPQSERVARLLGFANIVPANAVAGVAATAWGEVSVPGAPDGTAALLIRSSGVRLGIMGLAGYDGRSATVVGRAFVGDHTAVRVAMDDGSRLEALVLTTAAPEPGQVVSVNIDPDAVVVLGS